MDRPIGDAEQLVIECHQRALRDWRPEDLPDDQPLAQEWKTFQRQYAGLLEDGHGGRFALIKGDSLHSVWDTEPDARQAGRLFFDTELVLVQRIAVGVQPPHYRRDPDGQLYLDDPARPTIHYSELPEARAGDPLAAEWNTYRHEVGRLLGEGHEGKFVLIKGQAIIGVFENEEAARERGSEAYRLEGFLVHRILTREPLLRLPWNYSACRV